MVFAEMQLFKRVKNNFSDSPLYQENDKIVKKPLPDDIDSDNEVNLESIEDPTTISYEQNVHILMILIVIILPNLTVNGSLMKISISIILCILMMYIVLLT